MVAATLKAVSRSMVKGKLWLAFKDPAPEDPVSPAVLTMVYDPETQVVTEAFRHGRRRGVKRRQQHLLNVATTALAARALGVWPTLEIDL